MNDFPKVKHTQLASVKSKDTKLVCLFPKPTLFPHPLPVRSSRNHSGYLEPQNLGLCICSVLNIAQVSRPIQQHLRGTESLIPVLLTPRKVHPAPRDSISSGVCPLSQLHPSPLLTNPLPSSIFNICGIAFVHSWPTLEWITGCREVIGCRACRSFRELAPNLFSL